MSEHPDEITRTDAMSEPMQTPALPATRRYRTMFGIGIALIAALATVVACSGSSSGSKKPSGAAPTSGTGATAQTGGQGFGGGSAASGQIAALEASSFEVQNASTGQVTVSYTSATHFTQTVTAKTSAIKVGSCLVAITGATTSPATASVPSGNGAATSITISPATNGSCSRTGFGGGFGGGIRPSEGAGGTRPTNFPTGFPTTRPTGARTFPGGAGGFGSVVTGKVTSVSGDKITVAAVKRAFTAGATASASPTATTPTTVTVGPSTVIKQTAAVTKSALKVGLCATADGKTDSTGAVAATAVALSTATSTGCETGFGGGFGGRRGFSGAGAGSSIANG
jgi:hypothetical protein